MTRRSTVLVTDSSLRTALYTIRSLGRHGVAITAVERAGSVAYDLGGMSRYVSRRVVVPDNHTEPDAFVDALLSLAEGHDALLPMGMHSIVPIARRADEFKGRTGIALAPSRTIEQVDNTRELLEIAARLGIPQPRRFRFRDGVLEDAPEAIPFPVIVKTGVEAGLPPADRYAIVNTAAELRAALERFRPVAEEPIVQELVRGEGIGVEVLLDGNSQPLATFCHRRLREYPLSGGPSTYCESIHHPVAQGLALRLLQGVQWVGLAMVEFKVDGTSGMPMLMEVNPRPWGSMALPIAAGIDFPWLWYQLARGAAIAPSTGFPAGVRLRFILNDMQAALAQARRGAGLGRVRPFMSLLDPRVHEGVLSLTDPRPSLAYLGKAWHAAVSGGGAF